MKRVGFVLWLLVASTAAAEQGKQPPRSTPKDRIHEVRFAGDPTFEPDALKEVLEALKVRRLIPGIWTRRPAYSVRALDADLARLRSFYFSNGYFDARVGIGDVKVDRREATVTLSLQSGLKSRVRHVKIKGLVNDHQKIISGSNGEFPVEQLCKCLLDAKRVAEAHGRIDFAAELDVTEANGAPPAGSERNWVDVTARVRTGSPYVVGRINFSGHYRINESTLRRAMVLKERDLFDVGKLWRSLARLNRSGLLEPITADDVEIQRNVADLTADLTISLRERPRGQWWLSGPVAATSLLQASISSRLPPWGRGVFEASTYYVTFSLIGLPNPLVRLLPFAPKPPRSAWLLLERPYLPGQALFSGFALSPKQPVQTMLTSYGVTHLGRAARAVLGSDASVASTLLVPVQQSGFLICEPPEARLRWLRRGGAYAADLALGSFQPF